MTVTDSVVRLAGTHSEFRLRRREVGVWEIWETWVRGWVRPLPHWGAAKIEGHPRQWRFRRAALWRGSRGRPSPHESLRSFRPLLVSSSMMQSISLWGCGGLGWGAGKGFRLALSADRYRSSRLGRFAGGGGEPLAYS